MCGDERCIRLLAIIRRAALQNEFFFFFGGIEFSKIVYGKILSYWISWWFNIWLRSDRMDSPVQELEYIHLPSNAGQSSFHWSRNQFLALSTGFSCFCDELKALSVSLLLLLLRDCFSIPYLFLVAAALWLTLSFSVDAVLEALRQSLIVTTAHAHTVLRCRSTWFQQSFACTVGQPINETKKKKKKNKRENWRTIPGASCFLHIKGGPKPPTGYFKMRKSISYSLEKKGNDDHERDHTAWHALFSFIGKFVDKTENRQANKVSLVDRKRAKGKRGARRKWTDKRRRRWTPTCRRRRNRPATCWRRARRSPGNKRCPKSSSPFSDWDSEDFSSAIDVLIELLLLFSLSCFHTAAQRL